MPLKAGFRRWSTMTLIVFVLCAMSSLSAFSQTAVRGPRQNAEELRTARYMESVRDKPPQLLAFLRLMPKGGDLHNHLSGAVYAESFVRWAAEAGLCVDSSSMALAACDPAKSQSKAAEALTNGVLYRQLIDAWSMRNWQLSGQSGHDHFFDAFGKFGMATWNKTGAMLAEEVARAARGNVEYEELMLTPDLGFSGSLGGRIGWNDNAQDTLTKLLAAGIADAATQSKRNIETAESDKNNILKCGTDRADIGCNVKLRYVFQVSRGGELGPVFAQMVAAFITASQPDTKVVALNMVQGEDGLLSMQNFHTHMQMLDFLHGKYPNAHITLHAGELVSGIVPPDGLAFHIRESVLTGHAERIGHGVDIMHEDDAAGFLRELAKQNIAVEICLTSNDVILGVRGPEHPLATYLDFGVPVLLATDDEGVARSEMSLEYLKGAIEQKLDYSQLKTMARNSLEFAFLPGKSLWRDRKGFAPVSECSSEAAGSESISSKCKEFLDASEKAQLQLDLERRFAKFEVHY